MTLDLDGFVPDDEGDERYERARSEFEGASGRFRGFAGIRYAHAWFRLMCDQDQSWHHRAMAAAGVLYLVIPLDVYPDCIPGGLVDDLAVVIAVMLSLADVVEPYLEDER